ncbi:MAG: HAD-IIIA family hydrolase [Planctomycetota bacterium]|nr:MAG: HAD-IIIA family hydrolase [Planctomycetota bacterium]
MAECDTECLVLDVDGVLTDGRLWYGSHDEPLRAFHIRDGLAIQWFQRLIGPVAILTAKRSKAVATRAEELGVRRVIQGSRDKLADLTAHASSWGVSLERIAFMGDDLPDLPAMRACGFAIAPADAAEEVRAAADWVTKRGGGRGAVREAIEHLMRRAGRWEQVIAHYAGDASAPTTAAGGEDERA